MTKTYELTPELMSPKVLTRNGTVDPDLGIDRVYGGDCELIHVADGKRAAAGKAMAKVLDKAMREHAENRNDFERATQLLCPGCYMVVGFNMMTELAKRNGQPLKELALSMANAFTELANGGEDAIEHIQVMLDPE
jgi:hypothetical protein